MNRHLDERVVSQVITYKELPLEDILNALKTQLKINLRLDFRVYETRKLETLKIRCTFKNMTLRKHLETMLQEMDLDYYVRPNEIVVTTKELAAEARGERREKAGAGEPPKKSETDAAPKQQQPEGGGKPPEEKK